MIRTTVFCLLLTLLICINTAYAQTTQDSVKQTVNRLFTAMKAADAAGLQACFADSAVLQTIVHDHDKTAVRNEHVADFAAFVSKQQKGDADEQVSFDVVKADGELAIVWAPYKFYWKGAFSHCGTDSFQLIRINGVWKIQYLIDTRRKEKCE